MTGRVNPEMVRLGRESRGYTQTQLATEASVNQATVSRLELGTLEGSPETIGKIAAALGYPASFFYQRESYTGLGLSVLFYRKKASTLIGQMRRLEAEVNVRRLHAKALLRDVSLGTPNEMRVFDIEEMDGDAGAVAQMVRASWKMPPGPVSNLVALIESAGGVVFKFPFGTRDVDAMSHWPDDSPPLFFINSEADADRIRFSLAHELGHMVMHRKIADDIEDQANEFASEFLMPAKDIRHDLYNMSIEKAGKMKPFWRVSMGALLKRSHDLGCMPDDRYTSIFAYYSRLGFKRKEPLPIPQEDPRIVDKLIEAHATQNGFTPHDFSRLLHLTEDEVAEKYLPKPKGLRLAL